MQVAQLVGRHYRPENVVGQLGATAAIFAVAFVMMQPGEGRVGARRVRAGRGRRRWTREVGLSEGAALESFPCRNHDLVRSEKVQSLHSRVLLRARARRLTSRTRRRRRVSGGRSATRPDRRWPPVRRRRGCRPLRRTAASRAPRWFRTCRGVRRPAGRRAGDSGRESRLQRWRAATIFPVLAKKEKEKRDARPGDG